MRDIAATLLDWVVHDRPFATARVMSTWGSSPRRAGAAMAITADLDVVGSVSGGCIEGEVIDAARGVIAEGTRVILDYGVSNETAWSVGLSCGGKMSVLLERFPAFSEDRRTANVGKQIAAALNESRPIVWISDLEDVEPRHSLIDPQGTLIGDSAPADPDVLDRAVAAYGLRSTGPIEVGDRRYFVHVVPPPSTLLIIGATDIATHLVRMARGLDFTTLVIDPREVFASAVRFAPAPDRLVAQWPQEVLPGIDVNEETYAVLLTHDPKIDDPALRHLLGTEAAYLGALGSSRTHAKRRNRLAAAGLTDEQLDRIHGPVGLDIGAASPAEIALSVLAQVVEARNRRQAV